MRHTSRTRGSPDPLQPVHASTWLVVRNRAGQVLESAELAPNAEPRAVLEAARNERLKAGWAAERIGAACSFFFASHDGERVLVGIERIAPQSRASPRLDR